MSDFSALHVAVLQPGARLHYAVPTILQRAGMLQRLYTDCANIGFLRQVERVWPSDLQPAPLRRLFGRKLPSEIPASKVRQVRFAVGRDLLTRSVTRNTQKQNASSALLHRALRESFGGANTIYTVLVNEDLEFCRAAKERGCRIVHEAMSSPEIGLVRHAEHARYVGNERCESLDEIERGRDRDRQKYAVADLILAPSQFVREAVIALGAEKSKVAVVPYGIDSRWLALSSNPTRGRILFVGKVGLLKSSHYLAEATRKLMGRGISCDVRAVGPQDADVKNDALFAGPTYLGQIPRAEIHREYTTADIFVLPSLCEGMAMVTLEAMAAGLPVITTPNAGSAVRDGIDGLIVPARNAAALADAIEKILTDRSLRETMSRNARERAAAFTWECYEERLIGALSKISSASSAA
ncbi:MAG: glycosyltransferase family 4 protein [Proteobacteria bacterium]|nr:glycosyltransferase family 4 protein [Pseudomonadota bacterium]